MDESSSDDGTQSDNESEEGHYCSDMEYYPSDEDKAGEDAEEIRDETAEDSEEIRNETAKDDSYDKNGKAYKDCISFHTNSRFQQPPLKSAPLALLTESNSYL